MRKKYESIKIYFGNIFSQEGINFDVVNYEGYPEIVITHNNKQLPIDMVGSGIFEVLNLLAVVIGAEEKVILLDEPALHLHPVYQKKLLKDVFEKLNENGNNQIIIITHSPYFIDLKTLKNTFRFYKENSKTKVINVEELLNGIINLKDFTKNDALIRSLFANGVILVEGVSEFLSIPILLRKLNYALEDYNLEIINVESKTGFEKYVRLMNSLKIPCAVVCDGDTAYNLYNKDGGKWKLNKNLPHIINIYKKIKPFWVKDKDIDIDKILEDIENKIATKKSSLEEEIDKDDKLEEELVERGIKPIYEEIKDILINKLFIFACKEYDWTGFLGIKKDETEKCIQKAYEFDDEEKLKDLKNFIKNFIDKRINPKINHNTALNTFKDGGNHDYS
ncbi:ATP-dependent endonuclease [Methanocaldococcus sp. FS406-22]|uniref:ATP-dependent nuclease n=1 Tax=Methanocaldococcus sp. (strain FS406-22) TaxID=644281 RepID=UPI00373AEBC1